MGAVADVCVCEGWGQLVGCNVVLRNVAIHCNVRMYVLKDIARHATVALS